MSPLRSRPSRPQGRTGLPRRSPAQPQTADATQPRATALAWSWSSGGDGAWVPAGRVMKPGEADGFGTLKSLQSRALGALRRRGRQGLARGQLTRAEVSEQARRPAEPRSGPGRVRRERLRQGIQVVTQRELHATPHHEFLRLPGSKLPGALCRGPGPAGRGRWTRDRVHPPPTGCWGLLS